MADQLGAKATAREKTTESPDPRSERGDADEFNVDLFRTSRPADSGDDSKDDSKSEVETKTTRDLDQTRTGREFESSDAPLIDRSSPDGAAPETPASDDSPLSGLTRLRPGRANSDDPDRPSILDRLRSRPRGQMRARKVQRIVRRVDPWSVLKVSLLFYFCVWLMVLVSVVLVWGVAMSSGTVGSLESFIAEFLAFEEFRFNGDQLFQIFALGGLIAVFVATAATAILAVLFNLIADLTGGIRFTVVEEETARRIISQR